MGSTFQSSRFSKSQVVAEEEDGTVIAETDKILRSPSIYGNLTASYRPTEKWTLNLTSVYTGAMELFHEGENALKTSKGMFDFGLNTVYNLSFNDFFDMELSAGVKNIFNEYQKDFDKGVERDPTYIYGPALPRTIFAGVKIKM